MADTENTETTATEQKPAAETPWGEDFDAERAWKLVQNLRSERDDLKKKNTTYESERQAREDEGKSELQKLQDRAVAAEKAAKDAARELSLQKVLRKHPELEDFADLLTGDTEEELFAKADRLAAIGKPKEPAEDEQKADEQPELPGKPTPNLTPGHGGEETTPFDPTAIALAARK